MLLGQTTLVAYNNIGRQVSAEHHKKRVFLGLDYADRKLVYEWLRDYPRGLTVCEFLSKRGKVNAEAKLRYRPRFSELSAMGLVSQAKTTCSVCEKKETKYKVVTDG